LGEIGSAPILPLFVHQKNVNISQYSLNAVIVRATTLCNTPCFALQKYLFCSVKVPILQRKTGAFRTQNKQKYYNETKKINRRSRQKLNFQTPNVSSLNTFCNFALAG